MASMNIIVIGAHGKVALRALPQLAEGNNVRGVIRNPDHADEVAATGATPVVEDVEKLDPEGWAELLDGADTVVWSAGAGGGNPDRTYAVDRDAAIASIDATPTNAHYIMVSYWGASTGDQVPEDNSFHHYAVSKMKADEHLRNSRHRHTILKPAALTDDELGEIEIGDEEETNPGTTSREAVATLIARYANEGPSGDVCFVD